MKILFIQKEGGIFGAENYHLNIIPALQQKGVKIEFLRLYTNYQLGKDSEFVQKLQKLNVTVYQVNIGRIPGIRDIFSVASIIKQGAYDIIHSHLIHADFYAALIKTFFFVKSKFVSTKHGYDNSFTAKYGFDGSKQRKTPYFLISRWAEAKFDKTYTISKGLLNLFVETGITTASKMKLIYYGFDFLEPSIAGNASDYRISDYQLCIVGRLVEFKGHMWALQALKRLLNKYPSIKLVIIGTGSFENRLKEFVTELGLDNSVLFLGYRKDVALWMKHSDLVIVPSRSEGFGVVFLEAFSARTPVVAFDVPAANELIIDGETGALAVPYDTADLAVKISALLLDKEKAKSYANRAYDFSKKYFSLDTMTDNTYSFYHSVLQG